MEKAQVIAVSVTEGGPQVFFEISETRADKQSNAWRLVSADKDLKIDDAGASIKRLVASLKPIAAEIVRGLSESTDMKRPDSVEVELGVKLSGEVGFFVAKSSGEASINIKMSWKVD